MPRSRFPLAPLALCLSLALSATVQAQPAPAATVEIQLPTQPLAQALNALARQTRLDLLVQSALVASHTAPALAGRYSAQEAFDRLLAGSGLYADIQGSSVTIHARPQSQTTLAPVVVVGQRSPITENTGAYTTPAVSIGKGNQSLKDIPQTVTVITRQRLDEQQMTSIYDALGNTTGITLQQSPQSGKYVYSRGFRNTWYQYDGVPLERGMYGRASNLTGGTAIYDRIEVLRGAAGLLQGGGEPSGAVNFVRKRAPTEAMFHVVTKAGQWDHYALQADGGGPLNEAGTLRGRLLVDVDRRRSFTDYVHQNEQTFYGTLDYDITPDTQVSVGMSYEISDGLPNVRGLPSYTDGRKIDVPRRYFLGADWNRRHGTTQATYFDLSHHFNDKWQGQITAVNLRERLDMKYAGSIALVDPVSNDVRLDVDSTRADLKIWGIDAHLVGQVDAFGQRHEVVVGGNYARNNIDTTYGSLSNFWQGSFKDFDPTRLRDPSRAEIYARSREHRDGENIQYGVYSAARLQLADPLKLILGGRVSWYETHWDTTTTGARPSTSTSDLRHMGKFTPYAGLILALTPQWSMYASYTDIFKPQTARNASGKILDPILGSNYEVGIKGELLDGRVNTGIALFRIDQKNRAQTDYASGPNCDAGWYCSIAAGKVRSQGIDAEISGELTPGWNLFAGYTFNTTRYLKDQSRQGTSFNTFTPKHMLRLWSTYRLPGDLNRWTLGGGVNAESRSYEMGAVRFNNPGRAIWSAYTRYQIDNHWAVSLNINNLFDKTYYTNVGTNNGGFYGEPRNLMLTLRGSF